MRRRREALVMAMDARVLMGMSDARRKKHGFSRHRLVHGEAKGVTSRSRLRRIDEIDDELQARRAALDHRSYGLI